MEAGRVTAQTDFSLSSGEPLDRVRLLRDQGVGTLICGGMQDCFQTMVEGQGIRVVSWVSGEVDGLLARFLRGELCSGDACACDDGEER